MLFELLEGVNPACAHDGGSARLGVRVKTVDEDARGLGSDLDFFEEGGQRNAVPLGSAEHAEASVAAVVAGAFEEDFALGLAKIEEFAHLEGTAVFDLAFDGNRPAFVPVDLVRCARANEEAIVGRDEGFFRKPAEVGNEAALQALIERVVIFSREFFQELEVAQKLAL